jgi:peptidoglycan/LPS O-acetylase OafA/YrhL
VTGPEPAAIVRSTAIHAAQARTEVAGGPARHRADIDGLRAIAVLSVVFFHAGVGALSGGYVGVDVFFVISGFLITGIIKRDLEAGRFSIVAFYERQLRRIYPAL